MSLTLDDLYASPDHYLHSFDGADALFVPMDRDAYHRSIFLDDRISPAGEGVMRVPLGMFADIPPARPAGWIFHVAHCGSTLLARALDLPNANLVLREPLALRQAAIARDPRMIALAAAMSSKRYRADLPTVVKANVPVNFILPALLAADRRARAIFLYLELDEYVRAILRSDNHRAWLRRVTDLLAADLGSVGPRTDAERAAALWLAQMRAFAAALAASPGSATLDAETFFADPARTLRAAADLLGVPLTDGDVDTRIAGPLFQTYAKNPAQAFDNRARLARRAALASSLAAEVLEASAWIDNVGGSVSTPREIVARHLVR